MDADIMFSLFFLFDLSETVAQGMYQPTFKRRVFLPQVHLSRNILDVQRSMRFQLILNPVKLTVITANILKTFRRYFCMYIHLKSQIFSLLKQSIAFNFLFCVYICRVCTHMYIYACICWFVCGGILLYTYTTVYLCACVFYYRGLRLMWESFSVTLHLIH